MNTLQQLEEQETRRIVEWERRVEELVRSKGGSVSAKEFQSIVNVIFHDVEAISYDQLHREIWESSKLVFDKLAEDASAMLPAADRLTLVDVGCGTGLATEFMLRTPLGPRIRELLMVDTSNEMLSRCKVRSNSWPTKAQFIHGQIDAVADCSADLLVTSSVLHHLTDLVGFCSHVRRVLRPNGVFIHIHDPKRNGESNEDYQRRKESYLKFLKARRRSLLRLPVSGWNLFVRRFNAFFKRGYLDEVNRRLISAGVVTKPLRPREIWSITDLRAGDLPISAVDGICTDELTVALDGFEPVSIYTYNYFGVMRSHLPPHMADEEIRLFARNCPDGIRIAGVWKRGE